MRNTNPLYLAWREAELLAREANRKLFDRACIRAGLPPASDFQRASSLRAQATHLLSLYLDQVGQRAQRLQERDG